MVGSQREKYAAELRQRNRRNNGLATPTPLKNHLNQPRWKITRKIGLFGVRFFPMSVFSVFRAFAI
jgi:hypothetical protein